MAATTLVRTKVGTGRLDAVGRGLEDLYQARARPAGARFDELDAYSFARDRIGHKDDLALVAAEGRSTVSHG
jgi:hypothetical protein